MFCSVGNEIFSLLKYKEGIFCQFIEDRIFALFLPSTTGSMHRFDVRACVRAFERSLHLIMMMIMMI